MKKPRNGNNAIPHTIDYSKFNWSDRHWNPFIKNLWNALIQVDPANSEKGEYIGWRTYPDGTREMFEVER